MPNLSELAQTLHQDIEANPSLQHVIRYLLFARQAVGLENQEQIPPKLNLPSIGELWTQAGQQIDSLTERNPQLALDFALTLTTLPRDPKHEPVWQWLRGDGPLLLQRPTIKALLLQKPDALNKVLSLLISYLNHPLENLRDKDIAFSDPDAFLATASMSFGLSLTDEDIVHRSDLAEFRLQARQLLFDPFMRRLLGFYLQLPDTHDFTQKLLDHQLQLRSQLGLPPQDLIVAQHLAEQFPEAVANLRELLVNSADIQDVATLLLGAFGEFLTPNQQQAITGADQPHCGAGGVQIEIWDPQLIQIQDLARSTQVVLPDQPSRWAEVGITDPDEYARYLRVKFATALLLTDSLEFSEDRKSTLEATGLAAYAGTISLPIALPDGRFAIVRFGYSGEEGYQDRQLVRQFLTIQFAPN